MGYLIYDAIRTIKESKHVDIEIIVMTSSRIFACPEDVKSVYCEGGPAFKRNESLKFTIGDYIAFFDDDVRVDDTAIHEMYRVLREKDVGMVFGKLLKMDDAQTFDEAGSYLTSTGFLWSRGDRVKDVGQFRATENVLAGKSAACMIRRKTMAEVGMFDPTYEILGEETDLAWRVWLSGKTVKWVPWSITLHAFNTRFKNEDFYTPERVYYNGPKNYISMLLTNLTVCNIARIVPIHISLWFACGIGMWLKGRWKEGYLIFRGIFYNLGNIGFIRSKRERIKRYRVIKDRELFKIILRNPGLNYYRNRFFRYLFSSIHG